MNNQDPIADMLTRIRNANRVGRRMVLIPKSKICLGIAQVLKDEGYIDDYDRIDDERQGQIRVRLKYSMSGDKVIHSLDRESKPGRRVYRKVDDAKKELVVTRPDDEKPSKALHGLTRALLANMIKGVTEGYKKTLEVQGVGYKAEQKGKNLVLSVGYAHPITMPIPANVTMT